MLADKMVLRAFILFLPRAVMALRSSGNRFVAKSCFRCETFLIRCLARHGGG
ncbi:hypothetical protein [Lysobacter gummosus]|uniref:hypothetical protein n=1 Tax=Lysobacter gummosus TaxID=262324 RepID=UPI003639D36B